MNANAGSEIKVLIADDEPLARRGLQQVLAMHPDCRIVAECRNGKEAVRALRSLRPDVAFLDIQMPGLDGFEVMEAVAGESPPSVVLVTAYDEFAVRAFEAHALDYLLKPVSQERFDLAMSRVRDQLASRGAVDLNRQLLAYFQGVQPAVNGKPAARRIVVPTATGELMLDPAEIDWIAADDYYAVIHALGQRHFIRESLASLEQRLAAEQFVRAHRSAIVRLDRVRELRSTENGQVVLILRDGTEIPVSRRRREQVATRLRSR